MPAAMKEPAMAIIPVVRARAALIRSKALLGPESTSTIKPTMAAVQPPMPCRKATSCGIWIIFTVFDRYNPTPVPATMPSQIPGEEKEPSLSMVARMATAMAAAQVRLPRTAVLTLFIKWRPYRMPTVTNAAMI